MNARQNERGFTLLEVLVALAIMAVGAALTMSLMSGSLGNIRKVQLRTRTIQHAETVMELTLLDAAIRQPTRLQGDFQDGTRWQLLVEEIPPPPPPPTRIQGQVQMPVKMLSFAVEVFAPGSSGPDFRLQTMKLVSVNEIRTSALPSAVTP
jgi:general secretion pathway protein I